MESIKSIVNAFNAPKKVRKNLKTSKAIIRKWHKSNVAKVKANKFAKAKSDNKEIFDAFHKAIQPASKRDSKLASHPNIKWTGK